MNYSLVILVSSYLIILMSILGYGSFIFRRIYKNNFGDISIGFIGLYGIFFLICYSYLSHFFISHSATHNLFILIIGIIFFIYNFNYYEFKKENVSFFFIFFILVFGLLIYKTHDDFSYYHFPYTYYLTQKPLIIGIGQFNHGFRTPSSLFYLNSLFYLPIIKYYSFYIPTLIIMGFVNLIILKDIFKSIFEKKINYLFYFSLLIFIFINIFFYRFQEHGTDRTAQILIFLFFIQLFKYFEFENKNVNFSFDLIFLTLGIIISLKAFYLIYSILLLPIAWVLLKEKKIIHLFQMLKNKMFLCFIFILITILFINFLNTGCFIYPASITCIDNLDWSIGKIETNLMNEHYHLWSKAGKTPNFITDDPELYLSNFNWVPNWINLYFFNKVSDLIIGLIFLLTILIFIFFNKKKTKFNFEKKIFIIYLFIIFLLIEWFINHPALRYGGYILISLLIFVPSSIFLSIFKNDITKIKKMTLYLIVITLTIFIIRNVDRIYNEYKKYDYNIINNAFYRINEDHFRIDKLFKDLINNHEICGRNSNLCDKKKLNQIKEFDSNRYIFIRND